MLFTNGYIETGRSSGGGVDDVTGYPKKVSMSWDAPVQCQFKAPKMDLRARTADGSAYRDVSYEILVEWMPVDGERLRLYTVSGKLVGEFQMIRIMPLHEVSKVKIWV